MENALKYIVGPHASVSDELLAFAERQSESPRTLNEFLMYMPYFIQEARESGIRPYDYGEKKGDKKSDKKPINWENIVYERATEWLAYRGIPVNGIGFGNGYDFKYKKEEKKEKE